MYKTMMAPDESNSNGYNPRQYQSRIIAKPRSCMIYGNSGSAKTTQLYFIARYIWNTYKKHTRLIIGDPGGCAPFFESGMVDDGIVQIFDYSNRPVAYADLKRLSMGYWPRATKDGGEYFKSDENCITPAVTTPKQLGWDKIGAYMIDGMTSVGATLMAHCSDQEGGLGFKEAWTYTEEEFTIRGLQQGHYNIVQKEIYKLHTHGFNCLPIQFLIWTALVGKGEDKEREIKVYGPQLVGNATTGLVPSWFMDCFHVEKIIEEVEIEGNKQKVQRMVAWFTEHSHNGVEGIAGTPYLAKPRVLPELLKKYYGAFPNGYIPLKLEKGLDVHYQVLDVFNKQFREERIKG